jgi:putative acetyltransferase
MDATIRPLQEGETDAVVHIWRDACQHSYAFLARKFLRGYEKWMRSGVLYQYETLVIDEGGVRGFIVRAGNFVSLLFVDPRHQGRGLGKQLLDAAKGRAEELKTSAFAQNERAIRFYQREGFWATQVRVERESGETIVLFKWKRE